MREDTVFNFIKVKQLEKYLYGHKGFIAGGCFKNIFNNEKIKDVDIFFKRGVDWNDAVKYFDDNAEFYYENEKVKAYKLDDVTVELICTTYGTPEEILSKFDFSITKFAYYIETPEDSLLDIELGLHTKKEPEHKVMYHEDFFTHLHLKRLVIEEDWTQLGYPVSTYNRMFRYARYGFQPCRGTKIGVIRALREVPEEELALLDGGLYNGFD